MSNLKKVAYVVIPLAFATCAAKELAEAPKEQPSSTFIQPEPSEPPVGPSGQKVKRFLGQILGGEEEPLKNPEENTPMAPPLELLQDCLKDYFCTQSRGNLHCTYNGEDESPHPPVHITDSNYYGGFKVMNPDFSEKEETTIQVTVGYPRFQPLAPQFEYSLDKKDPQEIIETACEDIKAILENPESFADLVCEGNENCTPGEELNRYTQGPALVQKSTDMAEALEAAGIPHTQNGALFEVESPLDDRICFIRVNETESVYLDTPDEVIRDPKILVNNCGQGDFSFRTADEVIEHLFTPPER